MHAAPPVLPPSPPPVAAPIVLPAAWRMEPGCGTLYLKGCPILRLAGAEANRVEAIAWQLDRLAFDGPLHGDELSPGRRGDVYVVRYGDHEVLAVTPAMVQAAHRAPAVVTLDLVDRMRSALGGMPLQAEASRGGIPGFSNRVGVASWYGGAFRDRRMADGARFEPAAFTAAHRTLPLGTLLLVTNLANRRSALVQVTDRGPYVHGRVLDLSRGAAAALRMLHAGVARVRFTIFRGAPRKAST